MSNEKVIDIITKPLERKIKFGNIVNASNIMVLSPHHDDEVLGCGGTLLRYLENDTKILIVYITDGRYGIGDKNIVIRKDEARAAWKDYINVKQVFLDFEDTKLEENSENAAGKLSELISEFKPEIIFTPWMIDLHPDHKITSKILYDALLKQNYLDKLIMFYEVMCPLYANHSVNITKQYLQKNKMIENYRSQHSYLNIREISDTLSNFRANLFRLKAIKHAEGFYVSNLERFKLIIESMYLGER